MTDVSTYPGTPRWVKVTAVVAGVLVLVVAALIHAGTLHGPGMHGVHGDYADHSDHADQGYHADHPSAGDGADHSGHP